MSEVDRRRVMSSAEFDSIPEDDEYPIDDLYDALIIQNDRFTTDVYEQAERLKELTNGQRLLFQLGAFDGQVKNGGITQFFWNCPEAIFDVADSLTFLGVTELHVNYDRALEALFGKKDTWLSLKLEWNAGDDKPNWETFRQTYELLDLGWFEDAYFDKYGYDEKQKWVRKSRGLNHAMLMRLAEYVRTHRSEFINEPKLT